MIYSRVRTLISLLIVFCLGGAFLWGGSRLLDSVTGAAPPPPTATPAPVIEGPTAVPSPTRVKGKATVAHRAPTPTPIPPTPQPSPTPKGPPKVFITTSLSTSSQATTFPAGLERLYCWVRNSALPVGATSVTFLWTKDVAAGGFLNQFPLARQAGDYTIAWFPFSAQAAGKYRCDVTINGQLIGSAHFTIG